ncbi:MAG: 3-phosphoshikimate 1-carboxyvinyltransferase, partial [Chthonomonadales bacterium]
MKTLGDLYPIRTVIDPVSGSVVVPGSKSITNRALILAALAEGSSILTGALASDDTHFMAESLNRLGVSVAHYPTACTFTVQGCGGRFPSSEAELFIGNSGTSSRFLIAALALSHGTYHVTGVERMSDRPILDLLDALNGLGADCKSETDRGGLPVTVNASGLRGGTTTMRA